MAANFLTRLNWSSDDDIAVFHAVHWIPFRYDEDVYSGDIPGRFVMEVDERIKKVVAGARTTDFAESKKIVELSREYLNKGFGNIHVPSKAGDPPTEILRIAETMEADIIAMGCINTKI